MRRPTPRADLLAALIALLLATLRFGLTESAAADLPDSSFAVNRRPGEQFKYSGFTLSSSSQIVVDCERNEALAESASVRLKNEDDVAGVCGRGGDPSLVRGRICLGPERFCAVRNFTCCGSGLEEQQFGVASLGGRIELCKATGNGWETRLEVASITDRWLPDLNIVNNIEFVLGKSPLGFSAEQRYRIEVESEISALTPRHFDILRLVFNSFCKGSPLRCQGTRSTNAEDRTGSFACFTPPEDSFESNADWLESSFPVLSIKVGDSGSLCVSPWSYFVPIGQKIFCAGVISSRRGVSVLGANMLEGHSITFLGGGAVQVQPANRTSSCMVSRFCGQRTDGDETTESPSLSIATPTDESASPTQSPKSSSSEPDDLESTASPSSNGWIVNLLTATPTSLTLMTESPTAPERKPTLFPTTRARSPTGRPTRSFRPIDDATLGGEPMPPTIGIVSNGGDEDTDIGPLIWFGVGSGLTFVLNCILFLYCRFCRSGRSHHKFTRLPAGDVEMTAPSPPVIQIAQQQPATASARVTPESSPRPKPPLNSIISAAAEPFEQNPVLAGGAAAFERAWNQGLIVDVWGMTLRVWQPNSIVDMLKRLRLLRVASGTVSGVDKMYWVAKQRSVSLSSQEMLGMIEISVDLTTKRLSAVFKMSRSPQTNAATAPPNAQALHDLFDAFKVVIEDALC